MLKLRLKYLVPAIIIFIVEVLIALFLHDEIIRPYIGDVLVVIMIYCFVQGFFILPVWPTALGVLLFAYLIETLQYFKIIYRLGLQNSQLARTIIGTSFAWVDLLAYTVGIAIVLMIERRKVQNSSNK